MTQAVISIRPYEDAECGEVLSWIGDERAFYKWSAGRLGAYPPDPARFDELRSTKRFTATDGDIAVGFFTARHPEGACAELRFGFVIVDPARRGQGVGREMLRLGLRRAFDDEKLERVTIAVFSNNAPARRLYERLGFRDTGERETYPIMGEEWECAVLALERAEYENAPKDAPVT